MAKLKIFLLAFSFVFVLGTAQANPKYWMFEWPNTDFSKTSIDFKDVLSGGPPKDGIPAIDKPFFITADLVKGLDEKEAVITVHINSESKAYPLRILMWHEIVNDIVGDVPIAVTYCPLCNAAIVFDRRLESGRILDFGTTGKLRNSDLIMYDRQTETWWQQFMGEAIVGELTGTLLNIIPSRLESWSLYKAKHPKGDVLIPNTPEMRAYGRNPYEGYAKAAYPFLFKGKLPKDIPPMASVLVIDKKAWSLDYVRAQKHFEADGIVIEWEPGQASALEGATVYQGSDLGNITVKKEGKDVAHHLTFAFAYRAFYPNGMIVQ